MDGKGSLSSASSAAVLAVLAVLAVQPGKQPKVDQEYIFKKIIISYLMVVSLLLWCKQGKQTFLGPMMCRF